MYDCRGVLQSGCGRQDSIKHELMVLLLFAPPLLLNWTCSRLSAYRSKPESQFLLIYSKSILELLKRLYGFIYALHHTEAVRADEFRLVLQSTNYSLRKEVKQQRKLKARQGKLLATCGCNVNFVEDRSESEIWNHTVKLALPHL